MQILNCTDDHGPTCMRHVFETLIGQHVVVFTKGPIPLGGVLTSYNGYLIHLTSDNGIKNTYMPVDNVVAISADK